MDSSGQHPSTPSLDACMISMEDISKLLYAGSLSRSSRCNDLASDWYLTPPLSPIVPITHTTVTIETSQPLPEPIIPAPDYDSDDSSWGKNSDTTFVIDDTVECQEAGSGKLNVGGSKDTSQRRTSDRHGTVGYCRNTEQILWPSTLASAWMDQSPNVSRIFFPEYHGSRLETRYRGCCSHECLTWMFSFVAIMTFLLCIDYFYPGSPSAYVCLVALVFLIIGGIISCLPYDS